MSLAASVLDALIEAGASAEMIVAAVKAEAAIDEAKAAERRAKDRDRQRRHRLSRPVTVTPCDTPPNDIDILTPENLIPQEAKASLPQTKKTRPSGRLPEDWEPKPLIGKAAAMVACWQAGELERELAKFKNYWLAKGGAGATSTNWQRNWVNWLINADERKPRHGRTNGLGRHQPDDGLSATTRAARAVFGAPAG